MKPRPERGVGQGTFPMPLGGGSRSGPGSTLFFWGLSVVRRESKLAVPATCEAGPLPLDPALWAAVAKELRLAPQQERIVALLLRGMRDKQIARELGLSVPTVRTYLGRIFLRLGVQDRVELILRVFATAQSAVSAKRHRD